MNRILRMIFIASLSLLVAATKEADINLTGIKGPVQQNIQSRLKEIAEESAFDTESDETIQKEVKKAMQPYGYFTPGINIINKTARSLTIKINPGPQIHFRSISIKIIGPGANQAELIKAQRECPIHQNQAFSSEQYEATKQALLNAAENQGYLKAFFSKAEILIDEQSHYADVELIFNTGPQYYFGQVRFSPSYLSPELLTRYIPFRYGETYSTEQVLTFNSDLSASGYFKEVVVKPQINDGQHIPMLVDLQPVSRLNYSLGLGYGTDTGPRGRAGLHVIPVNRYGHKFNTIVQGSLNENALQAQYIIPGKNPVTDQYNLNAGLTTLNYSAGYSNALLFSAAQRHSLKDIQSSVSLNSLFERFDYSQESKQNSSNFFPKLIFTLRHAEDALFSPTGYNFTLSGLGASDKLLSDISFAQTSLDARAAVNISPITTRLYLHGIIGITAINNIDQLPLSLAQLLGGAQNLRAYGFNSIGPGKLIHYAGIELQKETRSKWYLLSYFDLGDVYKPQTVDYKYDIGAGLMWVSPVGPIKISLAQAINPSFQPEKGRNPKLVISMGPDL